MSGTTVVQKFNRCCAMRGGNYASLPFWFLLGKQKEQEKANPYVIR
jgi:hypothetical protein